MLALLGITQMVAQDYDYVPFVREGVKWVYTYENYGGMSRPANPNLAYGTVYLTLELKGDTVINGKTYKAMHKYYGDAINTVNDTIPVYLREEDKVVYGIVPDGKTYPDCPIGNIYDYALLNNLENGDEFILYNFQDPQAYWRNLFSPDMSEADFEEIFCDFVLQSTSFMNIGTHMAKCYNFGNFRMIEGIGVDGKSSVWFGYTLFPWRPIYAGVSLDVLFKIRYVTEGDEIIYKSVNFEGEKPTGDDYEYIPYITPGVKFINEKVIVNNGDTTSYYYTYEMIPGQQITYLFDGSIDFQHDVLWCHYYTGPDIDESNDSIICGIYHCINPGDFNVFYNKALSKVQDEGRSLIAPIGVMASDYVLYDPLYSYFDFQFKTYRRFVSSLSLISDTPFLNSDNFYEVEPTVVDGREMQRYAFFDEQGDTLAYIVQGIGFDSYDMGDLLTPFTRKPDPDADYQEWCGLSHVVKDGRIIYKGMRYRHGAFTGINEVVVDKTRPIDDNYYNLMGQPVGKDVPTTPGIYIHHGKKICVSRMP